jgi:hypothetical protein
MTTNVNGMHTQPLPISAQLAAAQWVGTGMLPHAPLWAAELVSFASLIGPEKHLHAPDAVLQEQ